MVGPGDHLEVAGHAVGLAQARRRGDDGRELRQLGQQVTQQATVMTYNDLFFIFAVLTLVLAPLCLLLKPLDTSKPMAAH